MTVADTLTAWWETDFHGAARAALADDEAAELDGHLTGCEHCSCLLEQLPETAAVLGSRLGVDVPGTLRALVDATGDRGDALAGQLPRLHSDADEAEYFYPEFYTDGPDAGTWVDLPRRLGPRPGAVPGR